IGNLKGTTKKQITFFNTADTAHAELVNNQQTIITYVDWHPTDESKILASLSIQKGNGTKEEKIALVTLGSKSECKLGDVNCDSQINLLDIIKLITMVF